MNRFARRAAYRTSMFVLSIVLVVALWEMYKVVGPQDGGKLFGAGVLPRSNDTAMPHVWTMLSRYGRPEVRGSDKRVWLVVLEGAWFSFRLSVVGFLLGSSIGVGLSILMSRFKIVERYGDDSSVPKALTDYIKGRQGYDYNEHGRAGNSHTTFVPDEIIDRFCILGDANEHIRRLTELKELGVDQFAVYLQHDGKESTLEAYGETILPAIQEMSKAKQ